MFTIGGLVRIEKVVRREMITYTNFDSTFNYLRYERD